MVTVSQFMNYDLCAPFISASGDETSIKLLKVSSKMVPLARRNESISSDYENQYSKELQNGLDESQHCAHGLNDSNGREDNCPGVLVDRPRTPQTVSSPGKSGGHRVIQHQMQQ